MNLRSLLLARVRAEAKRTARLPLYQRYRKVKSISKQKPHLVFMKRIDIWYLGSAHVVISDGTVKIFRGEIRNYPVLVNYEWSGHGMAKRDSISAYAGGNLLVIRGWR